MAGACCLYTKVVWTKDYLVQELNHEVKKGEISSEQIEKEYFEDIFEASIGLCWFLSFLFISWIFLYNRDQFLNKKGQFVAFKSLKTEDSEK